MIEDFARLIPGDLLTGSGSVFYSGRTAFGNPSLLYVLGINPGTEPEKIRETVAEHTAKVLRQDENWSAYRDEPWHHGKPPGEQTMQKRVLHLFGQLRLNAGEVPCSNLVFKRTPRGSKDLDIDGLAPKCWPFHQEVINRLGVRVIMCFGHDVGGWVCKKFGAHTKVDEFTEKYPDRSWKSEVFKNGAGFTVIDLRHPGVADWTNALADPSGLVAKALQRASRSAT